MITGVGGHFLLQGIFPTQGSNPALLHCRQILYRLRHQGSPPYSVLFRYDRTCHPSHRLSPPPTGKMSSHKQNQKARHLVLKIYISEAPSRTVYRRECRQRKPWQSCLQGTSFLGWKEDRTEALFPLPYGSHLEIINEVRLHDLIKSPNIVILQIITEGFQKNSFRQNFRYAKSKNCPQMNTPWEVCIFQAVYVRPIQGTDILTCCGARTHFS